MYTIHATTSRCPCSGEFKKKNTSLFHYLSENSSLTIERKARVYAVFQLHHTCTEAPPARGTRKQDLPPSPNMVPAYAPQQAALQQKSWAGGKGKLQHGTVYRHVIRIHEAEELHKSVCFAAFTGDETLVIEGTYKTPL